MSYVIKEVRHQVGKAIHERGMISDGDHILVAMSGGKDSMAMLWALQERIRRVPIDYRLTAVHVDPGFGSDSGERMRRFLEDNGVPHIIVKTEIGPRAHGPENRKNPCFLCSRLRRKILFERAAELGCGKIALGHHKDDIIETFFLSVFYGASISTMRPVQPFFDGEITVIRPLYRVDEDLLRRFMAKMGWPRVDLGCPTDGSSKREEIKVMLRDLYRSNRKIKGNIFHALHNVRPEYLL